MEVKEEDDEESLFFNKIDFSFNNNYNNNIIINSNNINSNNNLINFDDILPFKTYEEEYPIFSENNYDIFGNNNNNNNSIMHVDSNNILNKINKFEDTYYNNIKNFPNTEVALYDKNILEMNLNLIEKTLPGLIICLLYRNNNNPIEETKIYEIVSKSYGDLRKPNGSKYKGNMLKVFKSTLTSSFIFQKTIDGKWFYKKKEAIDYVLRVTEKILAKKLEKEKNSEGIDDTRTTNSNKDKPKKTKEKIEGVNHKIIKIYGILDDLLNNYKDDKEISKILKNPLKNIISCVELLQKIGNDNKCVGVLMCFKFFKSIIRKYIKITSNKKGNNGTLNAEKIADKIDQLSNKNGLH